MTGQTADGLAIDRAAFLTFEVQPREAEIRDTRLNTALAALAILLVLVILLVLWKRKKTR